MFQHGHREQLYTCYDVDEAFLCLANKMFCVAQGRD